MTTHNPISYFRTPQKYSSLHNNPNRFTEENSNHYDVRKTDSVLATATSPLPIDYQSQCKTEAQRKANFLQLKIQQLKRYLKNNIQIDKNAIKIIFGWEVGNQNEEPQQKILKQLSHKVKALIKQNHELRAQYKNNEQWANIRKQNDRLRMTIDQIHRGQASREAILSQENKYLRDYIDRSRETLKEQKIQQNQKTVYHSFSLEKDFSEFRRYIMNYINTIIQANDQKLEAQARYIAGLQKRVIEIQKIQQYFQHLKFEKSVKLQQSFRKTKNFSSGAPKIIGDRFQYQIQSPNQIEKFEEKKHNYFKSKAFKQQSPKSDTHGKELAQLVLQNSQLQEQLSNLQEKYEKQVQSRVRDSSNKQQLLINIQRLTAEKIDLKHELEKIRKNKDRFSQLNMNFQNSSKDYERKNSTSSLRHQLADIIKQLRACRIDRLSDIQIQIQQLISEKQSLKKDIISMAQNSRFSSTHKELFLLRQRNCQLEKNCRFYEQQISEYEKSIRELSEESERRLAKDISRDIRQMKQERYDAESADWSRNAQECVVNTINRLENIEKQFQIYQKY